METLISILLPHTLVYRPNNNSRYFSIIIDGHVVLLKLWYTFCNTKYNAIVLVSFINIYLSAVCQSVLIIVSQIYPEHTTRITHRNGR